MKPTSKKNIAIFFICLAIGLVTFNACKKDSNSGTSRLEVRLTDAPGPYDAVFIDVQRVEVNVSADSGATSGWQTVSILHPGVYNLLDFRNGIDTLLAAADLPAGKLSQMRLILGNNNSVVIDGQSYTLKTPSAQQSGLKFNIHATLVSGIVYRLWIDFDASRSIVTTGSGQFILKPVIRTYTEAIGGSIKGYVLPADAAPQVWAIHGLDSLLALPDPTTGYYFFGGVEEGSWQLVMHARTQGYADNTLTISVTTGAVYDAGTVTLQKQ